MKYDYVSIREAYGIIGDGLPVIEVDLHPHNVAKFSMFFQLVLIGFWKATTLVLGFPLKKAMKRLHSNYLPNKIEN